MFCVRAITAGGGGFVFSQNSGVISERSYGSNSSDQVGVTRLMDLKRETRAKEEQITLVRNRLEVRIYNGIRVLIMLNPLAAAEA